MTYPAIRKSSHRHARKGPIPWYAKTRESLDMFQNPGVASPTRIKLPGVEPKKKTAKSKPSRSKQRPKLRLATSKAQEKANLELEKLLADTYALHLKAQNFFWNASEPSYTSVIPELKMEERELRIAVERIAKRIHAKGRRVPGTLTDLEGLTSISEQRRVPSPAAMLSFLKKGHKKLERQAAKVGHLAKRANDLKTERLAKDRLMKHKMMLHKLNEIK